MPAPDWGPATLQTKPSPLFSLLLQGHAGVKAAGEEVDDDIDPNLSAMPEFRILMSLLETLFELGANPWLQRQVKGFLHNFIRIAMGGSINRRVKSAVDGLTSPEQVAAWVNQMRDAMWPNGQPAPELPQRPEDCITRTRIEARAKLLGLLPDELRRIVGQEAAKRGVLGYVGSGWDRVGLGGWGGVSKMRFWEVWCLLCAPSSQYQTLSSSPEPSFFQMLQHPRLNKRFIYTLLEALLLRLFPAPNNFVELFARLHAASADPTKQQRATPRASPWL